MVTVFPPADAEAARLARLRAYQILDTAPEAEFERITRLAASLLDMPISAVSLIDADRQWFKSVIGLDFRETPREVAFCAHAIQGIGLMEVPDATRDPRFADNPLVTGGPGIRFYAGAPLVTGDGVSLGALCVIDRRPRHLTDDQRQVLSDLAAMAVDALDLRSALREATEREVATQKARQELAVSEHRLRAILQTAVDPILTIDVRGIIQTVNAATETLFGWTEAEMIGRNVSMLMPDPHASAHDGYIQRYQDTGVPHIIGIGREVPARRKDGTIFPCELSVSRVDLGDGEVVFTGILRDLSDWNAAQETLRERNRLLGMAEQLAGIGHWRVERHSREVTWSDGMYGIFGRSRETFRPTVEDVVACHTEAERPRLMAAVGQALDVGTGFSLDTQVVLPGGTVRDVAILARCEVDGDGTATAIFGVMQDITDRKRAEADLKVSEERLQRATGFAEIGTWEWMLDSGAVFCSDRMVTLFGAAPAGLGPTIGHLMERIHPADREAVKKAAEACLKGLRAYDIEHRVEWPNGRIHWLHARGDVVRAADGTPVRMLGVVRDITRTKAAEMALKESQRRLRVAIENISDGFLLVDNEDRVVLWNEKLKSLYPRLAPHLYVGIPFEETVRAGVRHGQYANAIGREEEFIAERMARHRLDEELYEERLTDALGDERWVRVAERTIPGGGGRVGIRADVTELRRAQQEADTANKAKSEFLSSMSHELRTPLNAILGFAQLLEASRRDPLTDKQKSHVQHILKGGQHLLDLINEVLDLARIEAGKMTLSIEDISPADVVEECLSLTETLAARRAITVVRDGPSALPAVRADYTRLKQVLLNLLSNAVKYNRDGGRITLAIGAGAPATMRFSVTDTGRGIPADRQGELFQPFNRLGAEATEVEGTGIGLTLTRELVQRMGGSIGFVSTSEVGSTFWVDIPLAESKALVTAEDGVVAPVELGTASDRSLRVLYIEDNPANMRLMEEVMEEVGDVTLSTAHTAELGIEMVIRDRPDLVIMDINLPGMDGYRAVGVLRDTAETRAIPVIALSANATASAIQKGLAAGFDAYLTKPVVIPELMQAITKAVEDRRG